jgi:transcriptional regulator with XRE-family HTH domain
MPGRTISPRALRAARRELGLSLEKVAQQLEVSEKTVRRWERGDNPIKGYYLRPLAELLEVEPEELLESAGLKVAK